MLYQLRRHVVREVVAGVEHGPQDAFDRQPRVDALADLLDRRHQARQPLERVILALHRDQHRVRRRQAVERQDVQGRRAIDDHDVVAVPERRQGLLQPVFAPDRRVQELDLGHRQVLVAGQQVEAARIDGHDDVRRRAVAQQDVADRALEQALVHAAAHRRVALRVEIDQQHAAPGSGERGRQVDGRRRLADATLLVCDCDDAMHGEAQIAAKRAGRQKRGARHVPGTS